MKRILLIMCVPALLAACNQGSDDQTTAAEEDTLAVVEEDLSTGSFGAEITADGAIAATDLFGMMKGYDTLQVKLTGSINSVCQNKGCWMTIDMGNEEEMMVSFSDYGFFVPKNAAGNKAVIEGIAFIDTFSVEMLRHYAEDGGEPEEVINAITEPEVKVAFTADGVLLLSKFCSETFNPPF